MLYYIQYEGQSIGPMTATQMTAYDISQSTLVCPEGDNEWKELYYYPELMQALYTARESTADEFSTSISTRTLCGLCAIFAGGFGAQYFIVDNIRGGFINIALSVCTLGLWSIVTFIQGIMMLSMSDEEFQEKYVDTPKVFPIF